MAQQQQQEQVHERGQVHWGPSRDREEMGREDRSPGSYYLVNIVLLGAGGKQIPLMSWMCVRIRVTQLCGYTRLRPHVGPRGQAQEVLKLHCLIGWLPACVL